MMGVQIGSMSIGMSLDTARLVRDARTLDAKLKPIAERVSRLGRSISTRVALPLAALGTLAVRAWDKQAKAVAQVEAGIRSTGSAARLTLDQLKAAARALQQDTLFGDEEILQGATAQLITFTNITEERFLRTQRVAADLATRLGGDLKGATIQLGKALNDPIANLSALSRSGIQFSIEQKGVIKSLVETSRMAEAQTVILDELERQYGGAAAAAAKAGLGPLKQLSNAAADLSEEFGGLIVEGILPFVGAAREMVSALQGLDRATKTTIVRVGALVAAIGPLLIALGGVLRLLPLLKAGFTAVSGPVGLAVAAIGTLVYAGYDLITNWEVRRREWEGVWQQMVLAVTLNLAAISTILGNFTASVAPAFSSVFAALNVRLKEAFAAAIADGRQLRKELEAIAGLAPGLAGTLSTHRPVPFPAGLGLPTPPTPDDDGVEVIPSSTRRKLIDQYWKFFKDIGAKMALGLAISFAEKAQTLVPESLEKMRIQPWQQALGAKFQSGFKGGLFGDLEGERGKLARLIRPLKMTEEQIGRLREAAAQSKTEFATLLEELESWGHQAKRIIEDVATVSLQNFVDTLSYGLADLLTFSQSIGDFFKNLVGVVRSAVQQIIAEFAKLALLKGLQLLGGLLGGPVGGFLATFATGGLKARGFATGGVALKPMIAKVAEQGPEAIMSMSHLTSVIRAAAGSGGGSGATVRLILEPRVTPKGDLLFALREAIKAEGRSGYGQQLVIG